MATMKHTKSPSGKTHRLQDEKGTYVVLRYRHRPDFDDQVQGDLIRKYREKTGSARPIGVLPVHVDAALLDQGQQQPSLDYLRGYLEGLEYEAMQPRAAAIRNTRAQIAALEAAQRGLATSPLVPGTGGPISSIPPQGPPPAAGAASIQINQVQPPLIPGLAAAEHQRRMREQS